MLGTTQKDKITGFEGIVTGHARYITGCDQYLIVPKVKEDGTSISGQWFDDSRLERVGETVLVLEPEDQPRTGADMEAPIK